MKYIGTFLRTSGIAVWTYNAYLLFSLDFVVAGVFLSALMFYAAKVSYELVE